MTVLFFQVKKHSEFIDWTGTINYLIKLTTLTDPSIYTLYAGDVIVAKKIIHILLNTANKTITRVSQDRADRFMWVSF